MRAIMHFFFVSRECFHFRACFASSLTSCDFLKSPPPSPSVYFMMMMTSMRSQASDVMRMIRHVDIRIFPRNIRE